MFENEGIMRKKILLLSAYNAQSHSQWHHMLTNGMEGYEWTVLTLPAHHFFWRARSNGLSFAIEYRETLTAGYDLVLATSILDLATLRGLVPQLASIPALVYFHENQFDYPLRLAAPEHRIINSQFSSIVTALCATKVLFNSEYNRRTFFSGTRKFVKRMPDGLSPAIAQDIEDKSSVLAVPIEDYSVIRSHRNTGEPTGRNFGRPDTFDVVWAHRWEFDKQPEVFFEAMEKLYKLPVFVESGITVRLHVMGQSFRKIPDCFELAKLCGLHNLKTWGYQSRADYYRVLSTSDFVISTALHDFQGLSMLEAIHQGCIPLAPDRVAYPEYIPRELLYEVDKPEQESSALAVKLCELLLAKQKQELAGIKSRLDVSNYLESNLISRYASEIEALL